MIFGAPSILTNGLIMYLDAKNTKSYPGTGGTWVDLTGNNNSGSLANGVSYSNGAMVFDGVDDVINLNNTITTGQSPVTLCAWMKPSSLTGTYMVAFGIGRGNNNGSLYVGWVSSAQVGTSNSFGGGGYGVNIGSGITDLTTYHNVVLSSTGGAGVTLKLYIDGIFRGQTNTNVNVTTTWIIGRGSDGATPNYYFRGNVSHASLYNRTLSQSEIQQNYNALKGRYT